MFRRPSQQVCWSLFEDYKDTRTGCLLTCGELRQVGGRWDPSAANQLRRKEREGSTNTGVSTALSTYANHVDESPDHLVEQHGGYSKRTSKVIPILTMITVITGLALLLLRTGLLLVRDNDVK